MSDKKRVNLTVKPSKKAEWKRAVEESNEYRSLSDLIRTSVSNELADDPPTENTGPDRLTGQAGTGIEEQKLEEIGHTLELIQTAIVSLNDRMENIEKQVNPEAKTDMKNRVYNALPHDSDPHEPEGKTVEEIAEQTGLTPGDVSDTLSDLQSETGTVKIAFTNVDGEEFWCMEGN
jgi:hypothetical protein